MERRPMLKYADKDCLSLQTSGLILEVYLSRWNIRVVTLFASQYLSKADLRLSTEVAISVLVHLDDSNILSCRYH